MKKATFLLALLAVLTLLAGAAYVLARQDGTAEIQASVSLSDALRSDGSAGFARVLEPRSFSFPEDHGPHPEYAIEWWYYTGNLDTAEGSHFGYELTFFRIGLTPRPSERPSRWAASQMYMAHFALTDVEGNRFYSFQRLSREALGLSGAQASPFRVWLEDWSAQGEGDDALPMRLRASEGPVTIDLTLESAKPIVLQGDRGFSQKSAAPGNASYYYSMTRMPTSGTVQVGDKSFEVTGTSWMDREWSSGALGDDQVGWDWFALQLSDGREITYYQLRLRDGGIDPHSSGTLVMADGTTRRLHQADVQTEVKDYWRSPRSGATYPVQWRFSIPSEALVLEIAPCISDQELDVSVRYWEGAVKIEGAAAGLPVSGVGYVEMTGYADEIGGRQ